MAEDCWGAHRVSSMVSRELNHQDPGWPRGAIRDSLPRVRRHAAFDGRGDPCDRDRSEAGQVDADVRRANVDYDGQSICAVVHRGNLHGCQFHPERSVLPGLAMLRRFLAL